MEWRNIVWKRIPKALVKMAVFASIATTVILLLFSSGVLSLPGFMILGIVPLYFPFLLGLREYLLEEEWRQKRIYKEVHYLPPPGIRIFTILSRPLYRRLGNYVIWGANNFKPEENNKWATENGWKFLVARTKDIDVNFFFEDLLRGAEKKTGLKKKDVKKKVSFCSFGDGDIVVTYYKMKKLSI